MTVLPPLVKKELRESRQLRLEFKGRGNYTAALSVGWGWLVAKGRCIEDAIDALETELRGMKT